ncbi:hypothetical protein GUJ93_ZPchr0008g12169 [Zizania palustris]|uniref:Uncharacterized protein n=1 Tax=Zizania palustris TaxID=103762 RepID=A0A8J5V4V3_ZIZPA|nr:hypothetical protein GUJ93_ZPchr0008g12169 [Zizania palustris]
MFMAATTSVTSTTATLFAPIAMPTQLRSSPPSLPMSPTLFAPIAMSTPVVSTATTPVRPRHHALPPASIAAIPSAPIASAVVAPSAPIVTACHPRPPPPSRSPPSPCLVTHSFLVCPRRLPRSPLLPRPPSSPITSTAATPVRPRPIGFAPVAHRVRRHPPVLPPLCPPLSLRHPSSKVKANRPSLANIEIKEREKKRKRRRRK